MTCNAKLKREQHWAKGFIVQAPILANARGGRLCFKVIGQIQKNKN